MPCCPGGDDDAADHAGHSAVAGTGRRNVGRGAGHALLHGLPAAVGARHRGGRAVGIHHDTGLFIVPALLGSPRETMVAQLVIASVLELFDLRLAGALSALLLLCSIVVFYVYDRLAGLSSLAGEAPRRRGASGRMMGLLIALGRLADPLARTASRMRGAAAEAVHAGRGRAAGPAGDHRHPHRLHRGTFVSPAAARLQPAMVRDVPGLAGLARRVPAVLHRRIQHGGAGLALGFSARCMRLIARIRSSRWG